MIIEPKVREYICTTAHPQGCAESVRNQADYACKQGTVNGTKKALIIGCSTGYGLASRICALENCGADTLGIMFERQANGRRTATPGWYNTAEFHRLAAEKGAYAKTVNGDAFSKEIKDKAIELIKKDLGKVDLVVYSLAAPRRTDAEGKTWSSCLKTTGEAFTEKSLDLRNNEITEKTHLSRPAVSHHLQILKGARILKMRREATKNYYYFDPDMKSFELLIGVLKRAVSITSDLPDRSKNDED